MTNFSCVGGLLKGCGERNNYYIILSLHNSAMWVLLKIGGSLYEPKEQQHLYD
jgi:hypothetical protein